MLTTLAQAPVGASLVVARIAGEDFAARMARLGLYEGIRLMRLDETITVGPVKVRGVKGDAILSGGLAEHVVIHLDDDRRLPLLECAPRDSGHVEGTTGQTAVEDSLKELGIVEGDRIELVRRIPPMRYTFSVNGKGKVQMDENMASHLLGDTPEGPAQFSSVGIGVVFTVRRILPGDKADATLASLQVHPGTELVLFAVAVSQPLHFAKESPVACMTKSGMRLYFHAEDAEAIFVHTAATEPAQKRSSPGASPSPAS